MFRRPLARVAVVDHAYRVLLLHVREGRSLWWELPLGPAVPDALAEAGVARGARVGPCVWAHGRERTYVAWLDDPLAPRAEPVVRSAVLGERWWTLDELASSDETFRPARLPALMPALVRGEYGAAPVDCGA